MIKYLLYALLVLMLSGCSDDEPVRKPLPKQDIGKLVSITPTSGDIVASHVVTTKASLTVFDGASGMIGTEVYSDGHAVTIQQPGGGDRDYALRPYD